MAAQKKLVDPSLLPLQTEVERFIDFLQEKCWPLTPMPPVVVSFYPQPPNGSRLGHYWPGTWVAGKQQHSELILYADLCLQRGIRQVLQTVAHEMVHHWQETHGLRKIKNNFHNREWHSEARRIGLLTGEETCAPNASEAMKRKANKIGQTAAGPRFTRLVREFSPRLDAIPFRAIEGRERQKNKQAKWACGCGYAIRIATDPSKVKLACGVCGKPVKLLKGVEDAD